MPLLALLMFSIAGLASSPPLLTWEELSGLARERNASLRGSQKTREAAQSQRKQSWGNFLPKVSLSAERTRSVSEIASLETKKTDLRYGAKASLNLFSGFSATAIMSRSKAYESEAEAEFLLTSANLRRELRLAYFNLFVLQERLRLNEKDLKRVEQNQRLVEIKYNSGSEARWNLKKTRAELAQARFNIANSRSQIQNAREKLAELLQIDSLPHRPVAEPDRAVLEKSINMAEENVRNHPELKRNRYRALRAGEDIRLAKAGFYPSLDLALQRTLVDSRPESGAAIRTNGSAISLSAEWNIFNGAADFYKVQEANLNREAAELTVEGTERKLSSQLRQRAEILRSTLEYLPVTRSLREAAEERERTVSEQYRSGLKSYLDWEQAESQLLATEQAEIKALGDSLTAFAELELAQGLTLEQP